MADHFTCSICGETHEGLVTDWAYTLPDVVWAIPEPDRAERASFTADLCQFGDRHFIRGYLAVPLRDAEGQFGWGVWVEVDQPVFDRYVQIYDEDGSHEPLQPGSLANHIDAYDAPLGSPVLIRFGDPKHRPSVILPPGDDSRLAAEQRAGIGHPRHHEIIESLRGG